MLERFSANRKGLLVLLLVWLIGAAYMGLNLKRGWVPHDEGALGQAAERVLHGEIPHRDFDELYTGGLSYLDALVFRLFGVNLVWLRYLLFAFFLCWIPAVFAIAREFLSPWPAGAVTLVAVAWSTPNYAAAMPSWFCLFFATFGTLALARYIRMPSAHWLILAGLCGGFSFLIKTIGLYYVAGALLFFVYREQSLSRESSVGIRVRTPVYLGFLVACLMVFVFGLIRLVIPTGTAASIAHFVLPGVVISVLLALRELEGTSAGTRARLVELFRMVGPFALGSALPVLLFFLFYWYRGALAPLLNGLFVSPLQRVFGAQMELPSLVFEYPATLIALFLVGASSLRSIVRLFFSAFLVAAAALVLLTSRSVPLSYLIAFHSAWGAVPVLVVAALVALYSERRNSDPDTARNQLVILLLSMTALCSLVQFPFSAPIYFCYVAPLVVLLAALLLSRLRALPRVVVYTAISFYILFAAFVFRPSFLYAMGSQYAPDNQNVRLVLPRAGDLRVGSEEATQYAELIPFVSKLANGQPIIAAPDSPEVYFLSGTRNLTPVLFDFLRDPGDYKREIEGLIDQPDLVHVVVLKERPGFSVVQLSALQPLVRSKFPRSRKIGEFEVFWRP